MAGRTPLAGPRAAPLLRLAVGGRYAFLEPDLIAFQLHGRYHVIEIKSFALIDCQADGAKVAAAAIQSAVWPPPSRTGSTALAAWAPSYRLPCYQV